jgi:hypothetical protein
MEVSTLALPSSHRLTKLAISGILTEQHRPELEKKVGLSPESIANVRNTPVN